MVVVACHQTLYQIELPCFSCLAESNFAKSKRTKWARVQGFWQKAIKFEGIPWHGIGTLSFLNNNVPNFTATWLANRQWLLLTSQSQWVLKSWYTDGTLKQEFQRWLTERLNQRFSFSHGAGLSKCDRVTASNNPIQGPVVQKGDNTIQWKNLYSVPNNHLLASDLSSE